jgi:hypothetical protein
MAAWRDFLRSRSGFGFRGTSRRRHGRHRYLFQLAAEDARAVGLGHVVVCADVYGSELVYVGFMLVGF